MSIGIAVSTPAGVALAYDRRVYASQADIRHRRPHAHDDACKVTGFRWDADRAVLVGHTGFQRIGRDTWAWWIGTVARSFDGASAEEFADHLRHHANADIAPRAQEKGAGDTFLLASAFHGTTALHRVSLRVLGAKHLVEAHQVESEHGTLAMDGSGSRAIHITTAAHELLGEPLEPLTLVNRMTAMIGHACKCQHHGHTICQRGHALYLSASTGAEVECWEVCDQGRLTVKPAARLRNAAPAKAMVTHGR